MDVGENGRPRGPHMLVWFSINHPIVGVPNFDPYPYVIYEREISIISILMISCINGYMDENVLKSDFEAPFSLAVDLSEDSWWAQLRSSPIARAAHVDCCWDLLHTICWFSSHSMLSVLLNMSWRCGDVWGSRVGEPDRTCRIFIADRSASKRLAMYFHDIVGLSQKRYPRILLANIITPQYLKLQF